MHKNFDQSIQNVLPVGFGHFHLIINDRGKVEDYMFLDVNPAFEQLTGLQREEVVGKRVSRISTTAQTEGFNWFSYFESAVWPGKKQETTQWVDVGKVHLKITVTPLGELSFALILRHALEGSTADSIDDGVYGLPMDIEILFDSTHDAISLVEYQNGEFRYLRNNALHQRLSGLYNIAGKTPAEIVGDEVGARLWAYYEECVNTGRPVTYQQSFLFAPGKRTWQTEVTPLFYQNKVRYLLCSSKDVSELKKVQREKKDLTRLLQEMFNQHGAIKLIFDPASGHIIDANPSACKFYGYSRKELLNLFIGDINMLPPDQLEERFQSELQGQNYFPAVPYRLKNGEVRLLDVYSCPIADGKRTLLYSIIFDVTDREAYREELFREKEMLLITLRSIGDGVVTTDGSGLITSLNTVAQDLTGWKSDEAKGMPFSEVFKLQNEETGWQIDNPIQKVLDTGRIVGLANHTELLNRYGKYIPIADSAAPIKTELGETMGVVMVFRDVSEEKEHSKQIKFLSYHDPLTGLYNRRYIEEMLISLDREENLPISVVMGDVNGLKLTNDVFGHKAGDVLLQNVARLLEKNCKGDDLIARWGGDEFVIIMPRTSLRTAEKVIEKIKGSHISIGESGLYLSLSLGCANKDSMAGSLQTAMREAEEYMYHQKLLDGKSYRNAIISTLLSTLYEKSFETEEHSKRMGKYCHEIGHRLCLSSREMNELSLLALLHDIGKVSIDQEILRKPGPLTPAEWDEMKRHPEIGYRISHANPELAVVSELILAHHERWDGKGYPRGLKGEDIPLVCRILAITDAFDAMTNDRVYRKAMKLPEVIHELEENAGTQFDPEIVDLFVQILREEDGMDKLLEP